MRENTLQRGLLDHMLVLLGSGMAVYSVGMSLARPALANVLTLGVILSLTTGYGIARFAQGKKWAAWDGYLWTILAILAAMLVMPLNAILPEEGFPFQLLAGAWLSWMVILCGFVSWRDQTLLFLNLPCLALFGLVGTFDTFQPATLMFFGFLAASALLYARIHRRSMLERAREAGQGDPELLRRDAWRWMAGPEWGLASAAGVVLISVIAAPLLQFSLQEVSGSVRVSLPEPTAQRPTLNPSSGLSEQSIGRGAIAPSDRPVFQVDVERPGYFRHASYTTYTGRGWNRPPLGRILRDALPIEDLPDRREPIVTDNGGLVRFPDQVPFEPIDEYDVLPIRMRGAREGINMVFAPGPILEVFNLPESNLNFTWSGYVEIYPTVLPGRVVRATYRDSTVDPSMRKSTVPKTLEPVRQSYLDFDKATSRVVDFARTAAEKHDTDYAKARAIQRAIGNQVRYNLNAPATPSSADPVDHFLFESKEGYCDLFASSMVLGARAVGLPARYATGYILNDAQRDRDGFMTVRRRDAHAWAEIYFEGAGWIPFDATEGAAAVPGGERGSIPPDPTPFYQREWFRTGLNLAMVVGLGAVTVMLIGSFRPRARTREMAARAAIGRAHDSFQRAIESRTGTPRRYSQTTHEYVEASAQALDDTLPEARRLAQAFEDALFDSEAGDLPRLAEIGRGVAAFKAAVARLPRT